MAVTDSITMLKSGKHKKWKARYSGKKKSHKWQLWGVVACFGQQNP